MPPPFYCRDLLLFLTALTALAECVPSLPPPVGREALALQRAISAAVAAGDSALKIPAGDYVFSNTSLHITAARDLAIDATGVVFIFFYGFGMLLSDCRNTSVKGLTFDSDPPNYAQGKITEVFATSELAGGTAFTAKFDDRFIPPDTSVQPFSSPGGSAGAKVAFWDPSTRRMSYQVNFLKTTSSESEPEDSWRVTLQHQQGDPGLRVGNLVTIFPRKGFTWQCSNCSAVKAVGVTIHAGGNMGFLETDGAGGNVYQDVAITRRPGSAGLMALNADGFHSSDLGVGPTLQDSEISFTGDDFVNIHNRMKVVCAPVTFKPPLRAGLAIVDPSKSLSALQAGDELKFYALMPGVPHVGLSS